MPGFVASELWVNCTLGGSPHNTTRHKWDRPSIIATHAPLPQVEVTGTYSLTHSLTHALLFTLTSTCPFSH